MSELGDAVNFMRAVVEGFATHLEGKDASGETATPQEMGAVWHIVATIKNYDRPPKGAGRPYRPIGLDPADRRVWIEYNGNGGKWAPAIRKGYGDDLSLDEQKGHRKRIKAHLAEIESLGFALNEKGEIILD